MKKGPVRDFLTGSFLCFLQPYGSWTGLWVHSRPAGGT